MDWKTVMGGRRHGDLVFLPEHVVRQKEEEWRAEEAERARIEKQEAEEQERAIEEWVEAELRLDMKRFLYEQPLFPKSDQN